MHGENLELAFHVPGDEDRRHVGERGIGPQGLRLRRSSVMRQRSLVFELIMTLSSSRLTRARFAGSDHERRQITARAKVRSISLRQPYRGHMDHGFSTGNHDMNRR